MYYVYVIKSYQTNEYYKGLTNNIERRLKQHLTGKTYITKRLLPIKLIHVEICKSLREARSLEKFLKSGFGREIIKEIDADVAELVYAQS